MRIGTLVLLAGFLLYPLPASIPALALVIPLVPIGTALLFPSTTSLVSRVTDRAEYGTMMGVAQTFAGVARILAPLVATAAFQRLGHAAPFLVSAAVTAAVGLLAFRIAAPERAAGEPA
jgi:MFS family permease